jgi:HPt (histidine-containing phosphotransfer) domain-containing protein
MRVESLVPGEVLDVRGTLARFGGDQELFLEMTTMLLEDAPQLFSELRSAVVLKDASAIRMKAHALKGVLSGCGGVRASQAAQLLEDAGHAGRLDDTPGQIESLEAELSSLIKAIRAYRP